MWNAALRPWQREWIVPGATLGEVEDGTSVTSIVAGMLRRLQRLSPEVDHGSVDAGGHETAGARSAHETDVTGP